MALEVKSFSCPKCGSPLNLKNAARSRSVVCPACHSQLDLTGPQYQIGANVGPARTPRGLPLRIGLRGVLQGSEREIIGRVLYRDDEGYTWDEWLLLAASGDYYWLSDDEEEGLVLWHSFTPPQPVDPNTVREGQTINLDGTPSRVTEVGSAIIDYLEGELTWKAGKGEKMRALDAEGSGKLYSIEWTDTEIEFYRGQRQNRGEVSRAFGLEAAGSPAASAASGRLKKQVGLGAILIVFIAMAVMAFCCLGTLGAAGLSGNSDCLETPAAVRSADCVSGGSDDGGGFGSNGGGLGGGK